ncbi:hypothetical protein AB9P05_01650 [Roseivirga sp. BDSF3-8]|uniref:hypothetical protein n=1 Tax=Roseivirga sp. BDSF3-8 TaxID=3241598 RepID=UPI0035327390
MKRLSILLTIVLLGMSYLAMGQQRSLQYFRPPGQAGLNMFETPKQDTVEFDGLKVVVGGDFSIIFQGLTQTNDLVGDTLVDLASNFTLPTANLNLDVQIADGVRMHLRTYLSSRHHNEAWVKGGYFQIDKLDFIQEGFLDDFMEIATIRFGMDEINYGDTHFRRSDNARSIYNPFVGNYIMDAFTTEPFAELTLQKDGWLFVGGLSNGRLNQTPLSGDDGFVLYGKVGYDNYVSDDVRFRLTLSGYNSTDKSTRDYLYNGDRAGGRYYSVLEGQNDARVNDFLPRFNPGYAYQTAWQINPFVKAGGLEFFGVYERVSNGDDELGGNYNQLGGDLIYRFGSQENFYVGARYNRVSGEAIDGAPEVEIERTNLGGGWFLTNNVLAKLEYVTGNYGGPGFDNTKFQGAEYDGFVLEAVISF